MFRTGKVQGERDLKNWRKESKGLTLYSHHRAAELERETETVAVMQGLRVSFVTSVPPSSTL